MIDYSLNELIKTFETDSENYKKLQQERKLEWIQHYTHELFPDHWNDENPDYCKDQNPDRWKDENFFDINLALKSICQEIQSLRNSLEELQREVYNHDE